MKSSVYKSRWVLFFGVLIAYVSFSFTEAQARAGKGRSFGVGRAQKSYSNRPYQSPGYQNPNTNNPAYGNPRSPYSGQNPEQNRSGFFKNMAGGLVGGIAGGFIGNMLFRGLTGSAGTPGATGATGAAGSGFGGGGIGIFEILLLAGLGFLLFKLLRSRKQMAAATPEGQNFRVQEDYPMAEPSPTPISYNRADWRNNEAAHREKWMDLFFNIQTSWSRQDLSPVERHMTGEVHRFLQSELDQMKIQGHRNVIDRIAIRQTDVVDEWQEGNQEFVVVKFTANLVDYTTDLKSGNVVDGHQTEPIRFEEYWTFFREEEQGWLLSGIEQVST